ncbi:tripartite tricarboxylate transporter TctB family protein [Nocardiopsis sp. RSe5-2]|uniref:Tripartite tricarboxylate transporter TctB family protein n=1 Tax=Nocardiopsis endophytica TaxID=3018445 RepID=A0ABT4UCH6_9ACTN|nr:tripartite tricarboxylate transporter TctB family protein [Nocardiopsis endophytica]MDA2814694.1 tripartite tricarboxylate transporter TctB family protein [Nocardiopsis endophytica]
MSTEKGEMGEPARARTRTRDDSAPDDSAPDEGAAPGDAGAAEDTGTGEDGEDTAGGPVPGGQAPAAPPSRRYATAVALVPLGVGVTGIIGSFSLGVGRPAEPGPGLWPLAVSVAVTVFSLILAASPQTAGAAERFDRGALTVVAAIASLLGFVLLIERIGFEIPAVALLLLWLKVLGRERWPVSLAVAFGATAAVHLLFIVGLGVSLPHIVSF